MGLKEELAQAGIPLLTKDEQDAVAELWNTKLEAIRTSDNQTLVGLFKEFDNECARALLAPCPPPPPPALTRRRSDRAPQRAAPRAC